MLDVVNTVAWVLANLTILYIGVFVLAFVIMYYIFFDPNATTAGKMIFRFMLSLVGVIGLVFIGIFVDPIGGRTPLSYDGEAEWWRPLVRFGVYAYVAFSITTLAIALVMRKWFPHKVKKKADLALVKPRNDTSEIPLP